MRDRSSSLRRSLALTVSLALAATWAGGRAASKQVPIASTDALTAPERAARVTELRAELASRDRLRIAWAAHHAGQEQLAELAPELLALLSDSSLPFTLTLDKIAGRALLDALIVLDVRVPGRALAPYFALDHDRALILATRAPSEVVDELVTFSRDIRRNSRALATCLLFRAAPRFGALAVLRDVELHTTLVVRTGDHTSPEDDESERTRTYSDFGRDHGEPQVLYRIVRMPADQAAPIDSGALAFGWWRFVLEPGDELELADEPLSQTNITEVANAVLADVPEWKPLERRTEIVVDAAELDVVLPRVQRELDEQRTRWNALLRAFHTRGWIDFAMTRLAAPLEFYVRDERADQSTPLPPIDDDMRRWLAERAEAPASAPAPLDDAGRAALRADLASDSRARLAWAAAAISTTRVPGFAAELREALTQLSAEPSQGESLWATCAVFDALLRTRCSLPSDELTPWIQRGFSAQVISLAALSPSTTLDFLATGAAEPIPFRRHDFDWIACCNLLAHTAPARFASVAVRDLAIELELHVVDEAGQELQLMRRRGLGGGVACGLGRELPIWFPPIADYELMSPKRIAAETFAPGPTPAGSRRVVSEYPGGGCHWMYDVDDQRYRLELLSELAGEEHVDAALAKELDVPIVWSDAETFARDVRAARERVERAWVKIVESLTSRGLLAADAAIRSAPIRVRVYDERYETDVALPALDVK